MTKNITPRRRSLMRHLVSGPARCFISIGLVLASGCQSVPDDPRSTHIPGRAQIVVRTLSTDTRSPLKGVRVSLFGEDAELGEMQTSDPVETTAARFGQSPVTDERGFVEYDVPAGVEFTLTAHSEDAASRPVHEHVPSLRRDERRELILLIPLH